MKRFRDLRRDAETRNRNAEISLTRDRFIYPYFVIEGKNKRQPIRSMGGINRFSIDELIRDLEDTTAIGIHKILLFGVIEDSFKDERGTAAYAQGNLVARAVSVIKKRFPFVEVFTDVCLCEYTSHGHCGLILHNEVDNDSTLPLLAQMALTHAEAGADFVAPSAMMDGQIGAIRHVLDQHKLSTRILGYSAKYASSYYGPFREAVQSAPSFGDRKSYQMDYRTISQALGEVAADISEGASWVMVKPAHTYLDIIHRVKTTFPETILAAYQVSGEYMMIRAAAEAGLLDEQAAMIEALTAIKRAGADYIISYYKGELPENPLRKAERDLSAISFTKY